MDTADVVKVVLLAGTALVVVLSLLDALEFVAQVLVGLWRLLTWPARFAHRVAGRRQPGGPFMNSSTHSTRYKQSWTRRQYCGGQAGSDRTRDLGEGNHERG